jgi:hypothetical protein
MPAKAENEARCARSPKVNGFELTCRGCLDGEATRARVEAGY